MISNLVSNVSGIDLSTSSYGTKLTTIDQYAARFYLAERTTLISKIGLIATLIGTSILVASPYAAGFWAGKILTTSLLPELIKIGGVAALAFATFIITINQMVIFSKIASSIKAQRQEERIINALGGKKAYDILPRMSAEEVDFILLPVADKKYGNIALAGTMPAPDFKLFEPKHVHFPITVGVDRCNRPFLILKMKKKNFQTEPYVEIFYKNLLFNDWSAYSCGKVQSIGLCLQTLGSIGTAFDQSINNLKDLVQGSHPSLKLVS